jgi:diguanylate cyclase (GGDEF)-like protein/PAS domain S-box-containing protein
MIPSLSAKNFLNLISKHLPDMLWAKDLRGRYLFANQAICDHLLMATTDEVIGQSDVYFAMRERNKHPENPHWHTFGELCYNSDEVVIEQQKSMCFEEYGNIRGKLVYLEVHKAPLFDEKGNLIGTIGSGRDITKQKKLENELRAMQSLVDRGPVVLFEWRGEPGWPIQRVSANVEANLGIDHDSLLNQHVHFSDFIHPEDLARVSREVSDYLSAQTVNYTQDYRLYVKGKTIWVKDVTVVDYNDQGQAKTIRGYLYDNSLEIEAHAQVERLIFTDQLTALPNRQKLKADMDASNPCGCIVFNIDRFREINDFFGITIGDSILTQVANWFTSMQLKPYRTGGDEFAILWYDPISWHELEEKVQGWLLLLSETHFKIGDEFIPIRMNIGIALGGEKLLTQADIALHNAKEAKQAYSCYQKDENIEARYRMNIAMTSTIHKALLDGRIVCHYQPIVNVSNTNKIKYETLVRLIDETGSIISPMMFLPIAKKTKLYSQITRRVIHKACHCFEHRNEEFSINLSIDDIEDPITVQEIITTLLKTKTASRVVFEILESEGIENYHSVERFITQVKALGAKIAIDDFGTGYSNFEHVLKLNVDYIKIDGSLVQGIVSNERHRIIIETIVDFAQKIGAKTIAEFVSDEAIFNRLEALNINYSQGYYTGKPEPFGC